MRTKVKFLDPFTISVLFSICSIGMIALAIKTGNKNYALLTVLFAAIFALFFILATKSEGLILENEFDGKVRYKPEDGCEPKQLSNDELPIAADGVNTGIKPGKVFIIRRGTNVYIDKAGNIRSYSPISAWVNRWVSKDEIDSKKLKHWEKLFR